MSSVSVPVINMSSIAVHAITRAAAVSTGISIDFRIMYHPLCNGKAAASAGVFALLSTNCASVSRKALNSAFVIPISITSLPLFKGVVSLDLTSISYTFMRVMSILNYTFYRVKLHKDLFCFCSYLRAKLLLYSCILYAII